MGSVEFYEEVVSTRDFYEGGVCAEVDLVENLEFVHKGHFVAFFLYSVLINTKALQI